MDLTSKTLYRKVEKNYFLVVKMLFLVLNGIEWFHDREIHEAVHQEAYIYSPSDSLLSVFTLVSDMLRLVALLYLWVYILFDQAKHLNQALTLCSLD